MYVTVASYRMYYYYYYVSLLYPTSRRLFVADEPRVRSGVWEEPTAGCDRRVAALPVHHRHHHNHPRTTLQHTVSQRSSEDSWCSASDPDLSSDEESDRSASSSTRLEILYIYVLLQTYLYVCSLTH